MLKRLLAYSVCGFSVLCGSAAGQPLSSAPPFCSAAMLDVTALPTASTSGYGGHVFVLEFENVSGFACTLSSPQVSLFPRLDTNNQPRFAELRPSDSGYAAVPHPQVLEPKAWAHIVFVWTSRAGPELGCDEYSGLRMGFDYNWQERHLSGVDVRHLWIRACGPFGNTDFRLGKYDSAEPIPEGWFRWYLDDGLRGVKFQKPMPSASIAAETHQLSLAAKAERVMLGDHLFSLDLHFPRTASEGCAFSQMRKREADGGTVISLEQCDPTAPAKDGAPPVVPAYHEAGTLWLAMGNADFQPQHVGQLEYEVIAAVERPVGASVPTPYGRAAVHLIARDPTLPKQVAVLDPVPACTLGQLHVDSPAAILSSVLKTLRAYNAVNTSLQTCSLAGVPRTRGLDTKGDYNVFLTPACPNCDNEFFKARPNGRIDLKPGDTAHLLVGGTGNGKAYCMSTATFELNLNPEASLTEPMNTRPLAEQTSQSFYVPFDGHDCVALDISAWRQGAFDGKPFYAPEADGADDGNTAMALPAECNKPELLAHGRPHPVEGSHNPEYGFSMPQRRFTKGDSVPLYVWTVNRSDKPISIGICSDPSFLKAGGYVLYDGYGHRLLDNRQVAVDKQCHADPAGFRDRLDCSGFEPPPIPPHSCASSPVDLRTLYELPPGEYTVSTRDPGDTTSCPRAPVKPYIPNPFADITFTVSQP